MKKSQHDDSKNVLKGSGIFDSVPDKPISPTPTKQVSDSSDKKGITFSKSYSMTAREMTIIDRFLKAMKQVGNRRKYSDAAAVKCALRMAEKHVDESHAIEKYVLELEAEDPRGKK